jgi:uncharacterized protein (TIGR03067 family)
MLRLEISVVTCCLALSVLVSMSRASDPTPATHDRDQIKGTWQLVYAETEGKLAPVERIRNVRVEIKDGTHSVYIGEERVAHDIKFAIDPRATPRTTDDTLNEGPNAGKQIHGIYELDGDTLISCVAKAGEERPREFEAKAGTGHTLRVFKRVRSDEPPREKAIREELMRFGGTWIMKEFTVNGRNVPAESADTFQLVLRGDRWLTRTPQGTTSGVFKLDPDLKPKTIDLLFRTGPQPGKTLRGVYELTDDTYRLCINLGDQPRPKELASKPGSRTALEVLKRKAP